MPYPTSSHQKLFKAILGLKTEKETAAFLRDLLTISEIDAAAERWEMARLLWTTNLSYKEIAKKTGGSTTTITRVAQWLNHGMGGYRIILNRLFGPNKRQQLSAAAESYGQY